MRFIDLANMLYQRRSVLLFALEVPDNYDTTPSGNSTTSLYLNPANFVIPNLEEVKIVAFVIAKNKVESDISVNTDSNNESGFALGSFRRDSERKSKAPKHYDVKVDSRESPVHRDSKHIYLKDEQRKQDLERQRLQHNFHLRNEPQRLSEATVKTSFIAEHPFANKHTIVISRELRNIGELIRLLRARNLGDVSYLVILSPSEMTAEVWQTVADFEEIAFVRGSPTEDSCLIRAGVFRAKKVLILAHHTSRSSQANMSSDVTRALCDADGIFTYNVVTRLNPRAQVVVEIVDHCNIGFMESNVAMSTSYNYKLRPQYAGGAYFITSMLDSLVSQVTPFT